MIRKYLYIQDLYNKLKEQGLSSGKSWLLREEKAGRLRIRKDPKGWRRLTTEEIEKIVKAYSPGGKGRWICRITKKK